MVRVLHVVALSADGRELLLGASPDGRPSHSLPLDARLTRALRGEDPDGGTGAELQLSPRDIQARLRRGATVEEVAAEAGVGVARIERYAGPVRSERAQVLTDARSAYLVRPRSGRSGHPLGEAVAANLAATAFVRPETESWSAVRADDGTWSLTLRVVVRGRTRTARWRWSPSRHELTSLDAYATQLGFIDQGGSLPEPPPPIRPRSTRKTAASTAAPRRAAAKKSPAKKPAAKKPAPTKATPTKATPKKSARAAPKRSSAPRRRAT
ncbi:MAG TPA: septation protein SepH [Mycobacteriales bacterium]